jgi:predicted dehydrogenase
MERLRVGIVGLGMAVTPHARSLIDLKDRVEVAAAFSPSAARREAFAGRYGWPVVDSLQAILADDSIAAVLVLTPPNTHLEVVLACARAGKHVLLEKPLEIAVERAEALVRGCAEAGVRLGVVLQHRFRPAGLRLAELLADGRLGRLVGASAVVHNWRPQSYYDQPGRGTKARDGGGVLLTQAIHTLDLMIALVGAPAEVSAYAGTSLVHRMETEDLVGAAMRFPCGAIGTISATTAAFPGYPERIEVIGEHGMALIEGTRLAVHLHDGTEIREGGASLGGGTGADPMAFPHDYHRALIADFLEAIAARREPRVGGTEALKVHYLIDALLQSSEAHRPAVVQRG